MHCEMKSHIAMLKGCRRKGGHICCSQSLFREEHKLLRFKQMETFQFKFFRKFQPFMRSYVLKIITFSMLNVIIKKALITRVKHNEKISSY